MKWDNGEKTYEPLNIISSSDPVKCAIYRRENGILVLPGWKRL